MHQYALCEYYYQFVNMKDNFKTSNRLSSLKAFDYCRSCYGHLAGYVGVAITEAMEERDFLKKSKTSYSITEQGWHWLSHFDVCQIGYGKRRPLARRCLDGTERRPHLAGPIGSALLERMLEKDWFEKIESSRELIVTDNGRHALKKELGVVL